MASAEAALERLCSPEAEVSAHYLIGRDGRVWHLVEEAARSWHAGAGRWRGAEDVNSRSIGIELDNTGSHPFPAPQMAALERVLEGVLARWSIPPEGVIAHSDLAPARKSDPGPRFDWARLARAGLAAPAPSPVSAPPPEPPRFGALMARAGYDPEAGEAALLRALRHRWRPWGRGELSAADLALAAALACRA